MGNPNCYLMSIAVTFFFLQPIAEGNCGTYTSLAKVQHLFFSPVTGLSGLLTWVTLLCCIWSGEISKKLTSTKTFVLFC